MKRRKFIQQAGITSLAAGVAPAAIGATNFATAEYYELREYTLKRSSIPGSLSQYLEKALIPALNRHGASKVGVFEQVGLAEPSTLHVLIAYKDGNSFLGMKSALAGDQSYQAAAREYLELGPGQAPYLRVESSLLEAFSGMPQLELPPASSGLFELRIYESHNEDAHRRKVKMFNEGEIDLFLKVGLLPVFFGSCIVGKYAPQLTYMLHFKDMEERDANWKTFIDHPEWKIMSKLPEYVGTVSHIIRRFLTRTDFSQL